MTWLKRNSMEKSSLVKLWNVPYFHYLSIFRVAVFRRVTLTINCHEMDNRNAKIRDEANVLECWWFTNSHPRLDGIPSISFFHRRSTPFPGYTFIKTMNNLRKIIPFGKCLENVGKSKSPIVPSNFISLMDVMGLVSNRSTKCVFTIVVKVLNGKFGFDGFVSARYEPFCHSNLW